MNRNPQPATTSHDLALQAERHAALRRFAASLSHAIGTPLNVISGRAELIEFDAEDSPDIHDSASTIRRQAKRITVLVKGALKYVDSLDAELPRGNSSCLLEELRGAAESAGWRADFSLSGPPSELVRVEAMRAYALGLCRLGAQLGQATVVELTAAASGSAAKLRFSPGLQITALRPALEPWLEVEPPAAPGAGDSSTEARAVLDQRSAVQLAVALGCARDTGAELELTQSQGHTELSATWRA